MRQIIIFLLSIGAAYGQGSREITVGYADRYDSLPKIRFDAASKESFDRLPKQSQLIHKAPAMDKGMLAVPAGKGRLSLKKYDGSPGQGDGFRGWEYAGYFPLLKMHALLSHNVSEHIGFSDLVLIDSITADRYSIVSIGDDAVEVPIPSPGGRFLAYYYNPIYERNSSFIGILAVDAKDSRTKGPISELMSFQTKDWSVEEIRWAGSSSFIVKAYTVEIAGDTRTRKYAYYLAGLGNSGNAQPSQKSGARSGIAIADLKQTAACKSEKLAYHFPDIYARNEDNFFNQEIITGYAEASGLPLGKIKTPGQLLESIVKSRTEACRKEDNSSGLNTVSFEIGLNNGKILSLTMHYEILAGNLNIEEQHYNFDIANKKIFTADEVFRKDRISGLVSRINRELKEQLEGYSQESKDQEQQEAVDGLLANSSAIFTKEQLESFRLLEKGIEFKIDYGMQRGTLPLDSYLFMSYEELRGDLNEKARSAIIGQ